MERDDEKQLESALESAVKNKQTKIPGSINQFSFGSCLWNFARQPRA